MRCIFCEYPIRRIGKGQFESFSAGSEPRSAVNPYAIRVLQESYRIDASAARSKSCEEFKGQSFDFVIVIGDHETERCPTREGQPIVAHWTLPSPTGFNGNEEKTYRYFWCVSRYIYHRLELFCGLPFESLDRLRLEHATKEIGQTSTVFSQDMSAIIVQV